MPSKLNKGVVELLSDFRVCSKGEQLSPNQVQHRHAGMVSASS